MIELKVTSLNLKTPNEIVKALNDLLENKGLKSYARAVTNGNHLGYGIIRIADGSNSIHENLDSKEVVKIAISVIKALRDSGKFNPIAIFKLSNEDTENFICNHLPYDAFRHETSTYIPITRII